MTLWVVRAGRDGAFETRILETNRLYVGFDVEQDITDLGRDGLNALLEECDPAGSPQRIANRAGQLWRFAHEMETGACVIVPFKSKRTISVAEVTGPYEHVSESPHHARPIKWLAQDIPRSALRSDLRSSLYAHQTVYSFWQPKDAEDRVRALATAHQEPQRSSTEPLPLEGAEEDSAEDRPDLEAMADDEIDSLLTRQFRRPDGYDLERLVKALLEAKGYAVYQTPKGKDRGVDLLAAPGPLGFGKPRLCIQVKSGAGKTDRPTLDRLIGAMQNFQAEQGLLVSWGGFTKDLEDEEAAQFFRVRLWGKQALIDEVLDNYQNLDSDIKLELPLKQIWTVIQPE